MSGRRNEGRRRDTMANMIGAFMARLLIRRIVVIAE
jgi:hypothetical protein